MHRMALLRSINTNENDHGKGNYLMHTGRREMPGQEYPHLGSVAARFLAPERNPLPGYIHIQPGGGGLGGREAAFLGPKYGSLVPGQRPGPGEHRAAGLAERCRDRGPRGAAAAHQRPLRPAPAHRRDRGLHHHLRAGAAVDGAPRGVRRQPRSRPATTSATAPTISAATACSPAGCSRPGPRSSRSPTRTTTRTTRTSTSTSSRSASSTSRSPRCSTTWPQRGRLEHTLVVVMSEFGRTPQINHLLRPRPLGDGLVDRAGRRGDQAGRGRRQDQRQRHGGRRRPGPRRPPVPHLPPQPSDSTRPTPSRPNGRAIQIADPIRHGHRRSPGMNAPTAEPAVRPSTLAAPIAAEPEQTHVSKEFKHKSPLIACRFDPKGRFVFAVPRTIPSSAGTWRRASSPHWWATTAGSSAWPSTPTARRSSPAAAMAS